MHAHSMSAVVLLAVSSAHAADFTLPKAVEAREKYQEAMRELNGDYVRRLRGLQEKYVEALEDARKSAILNKRLDDAQAILTEMDAVKKELLEPLTDEPGLIILNAQWGIGHRWADVTKQIQGMVSGGKLKYTNKEFSVPDPYPGKQKSVVIIYRHGGRTLLDMAPYGWNVELPVPKSADTVSPKKK